MPTSITLNDRLAVRIAVLAAEAGQPVETFVERAFVSDKLAEAS